MKEKVINFLCLLEGYHQRLKEIHWSTSIKAEHLLTDDIDGSILEYEDKIAEVSMGIFNTRFGIGDLKTLIPDSKNLKSVLNELENDIFSLRNALENNKKYVGLQNALDDFTENIEQWKYLETFK